MTQNTRNLIKIFQKVFENYQKRFPQKFPRNNKYSSDTCKVANFRSLKQFDGKSSSIQVIKICNSTSVPRFPKSKTRQYGYPLTRLIFLMLQFWANNGTKKILQNDVFLYYVRTSLFLSHKTLEKRNFDKSYGSLYLRNLMNRLQDWLSKLPLSCFWCYLLRLSRVALDKLSSTSLPLHFEPYGALLCACVFLLGLKQNPKTEHWNQVNVFDCQWEFKHSL